MKRESKKDKAKRLEDQYRDILVDADILIDDLAMYIKNGYNLSDENKARINDIRERIALALVNRITTIE